MSDAKQSFPTSGRLAQNLDLSLPELKRRFQSATEKVHSYVVRTVKWDRNENLFEQTGSAPNFQGGYITLCTCKHQMRATQDSDSWLNTWIAGFASRCLGHHWLFYLAKISHACESQYDLWQFLQKTPKTVREAKSSLNDPFGDVFEPIGVLKGDERFDPACYHPPMLGHSHHNNGCHTAWVGDIRYRKARRYGQQPSLLVCEPSLSFMWQKPKIRLKEFHARNFRNWESASDFLEELEEKA